MTEQREPAPGFLGGGSAMGALIAGKDWGGTALGPPDRWPAALGAALAMALRSGEPLLVAWGSELTCLCNDVFIQTCSLSSVWTLGRPLSEVLWEHWGDIEPVVKRALAGNPHWLEDVPFPSCVEDGDNARYFNLCVTPLAVDADEIGGVLLHAQETTERVHLLRQQRARVEQQNRLFQQAPGFICTLSGPEHRFDFVNDEYVRLVGERHPVGRTVREVFPELAEQGVYDRLDQVWANAQRYVARGQQVLLKSVSGTDQRRWLDFIYAPVFGPEGNVEGIFCEGHDLTELYASQAALAEREAQLRLATDAGDIGLWDLDLQSGTLYWQPRVKAMFGISPAVPVTLQDFRAGLHPDDAHATEASFEAACDPIRRAPYDVEHRVIGKMDGAVRWVAAKGRGVFDDGGRCVRLIGTAIDITLRKANEEALRRSEAELRKAAQRKDQFIATLAHELRNPLAPLRTALRLVDRQGASAELHDLMKRQVEHLVQLVDDLMEASRISTGSFELRNEVVSIAAVVASALEASSPLVEQGRHHLSVPNSPSPATPKVASWPTRWSCHPSLPNAAATL